jgi:hypothetical protein
MIKYLGKIKLNDTVMVSDPCYKVGVWCQGEINNVLEGEYNVFISEDDGRIKELIVSNDKYPEIEDWEINMEQSFEVGVDSGNAGIFDYKYYYDTHEEDDILDEWYDDMLTGLFDNEDSKNWLFFRNHGVITSSGYGDGIYHCYTAEHDNKVMAIKIVFIDEGDN